MKSFHQGIRREREKSLRWVSTTDPLNESEHIQKRIQFSHFWYPYPSSQSLFFEVIFNIIRNWLTLETVSLCTGKLNILFFKIMNDIKACQKWYTDVFNLKWSYIYIYYPIFYAFFLKLIFFFLQFSFIWFFSIFNNWSCDNHMIMIFLSPTITKTIWNWFVKNHRKLFYMDHWRSSFQ